MKSIRTATPWLLLLPALLPGLGVLGIGLFKCLSASMGWMPALGLKTVTLHAYASLAGRHGLWTDFIYTVLFSLCAAALSVLIGSLAAWGMAGCRHGSVRRWCGFWVIMAVILPYGVAALGVQGFLGQSGLIARLAYALGFISTPGDFPVLLLTPAGLGLFWPYLWKGSAFTALVLKAYYEQVRTGLEDEARTLGAGGLKLWCSVYVPAGAGAMGVIGGVIYAYIFGGLEIPVWLGALSPRLMPARYYTLFMHPDLSLIPERMALVLMMAVLCLITATLFGMGFFALARRGFGYRLFLRALATFHSGPLSVRSGFSGRSAGAAGLLGIYGLLMGLPLVWLLLTGMNPAMRFPDLAPAQWQLTTGLGSVLNDPLLKNALQKGMLIAGLTGLYTALAAFPAGRAFARHQGFRGEGIARLLCALPLALPGIVIITGAQLCAIQLGFYGSLGAVVLCHWTLTLPYAVGIQTIYQKQLGTLQEEAARTLGASPWQTMRRILIPLMLPPLVISFSLGFLISFTETFSTQLVGNGRITTLGALLGPALAYGDMARGSGYMLFFILINGTVFCLSHWAARSYGAGPEQRAMEDAQHAGN